MNKTDQFAALIAFHTLLGPAGRHMLGKPERLKMLLNNAALLDAIETALIEANDAFKGWPELASAALRAIADAGFVIVPRETVEGLIGHAEWVSANFNIDWAHLAEARSALSAALKEMGAG